MELAREQWAERHAPAAASQGALLRRREEDGTAGDPILSRFGFKRYKTPGQRSAVRAVLTAPGGSTLLVILPTGAGKSLCSHLPATEDPNGLTIVIVPTVALALDQEHAIRQWREQPEEILGPGPYAYCGGTDESTRVANQKIREQIMRGEQRILFTSPEAALASLSTPLQESARP